jgi:hypothetical protein
MIAPIVLSRRRRILQCIAVVLAASTWCLAAPGLAAGADYGAPSAAAWAALSKLPDWSGVWIPNQLDQIAQRSTNPPPWKPEAAAQIAEQVQLEKAMRPLGLFVNCLPEGMPSWMLISHNAMEILYTPGRVTMLGESDGDRLRRIYTDGRAHPADPDPSFFGHSIGHWERDTLVVDTVGVFPEAYLAIAEWIGLPNNGDLHMIEHIHLAGPDRLHDDLEIIAPHLLTGPWKTTRVFNRKRGPQYDIAEGVCLQGSFSEATDSKGNAVFVPVERVEGNLHVHQ